MKKILVSVIAAAALFSVASCNSTNETVDLAGEWNIVAVDGTEITDTLVHTIAFDTEELRYHANPAINIVNGTYTYENGVLTIGQGGMTMMAGPEELMNLESKILATFETPCTTKMEGEVLQLSNEDGKVILELKK